MQYAKSGDYQVAYEVVGPHRSGLLRKRGANFADIAVEIHQHLPENEFVFSSVRSLSLTLNSGVARVRLNNPRPYTRVLANHDGEQREHREPSRRIPAKRFTRKLCMLLSGHSIALA